MALGDVIARLAVNLSLETAAFEKGATKSEKRFNRMKRKFSDFSKAITVGAAAVGTAIVAVNKVFSDLAQKSKEIATAAQVAGEGFEEFQRQAYGAKMVGIEFDKLGDIFKDVRDRIGDFNQTGGGPMADFFENIAPKVDITAKAFEGLGGRDALQLYYDSLKKANVSQEDMVFYLEAMASDATNLIPLLENGGAAWERYGSRAAVISEDQRAQLQRYTESMVKLDNSLQQLALTLVDSGLIDKFASFAEQLAAVTEGFSGVTVTANAADKELKKTQGARKFGNDLRALSDAIDAWYWQTTKASEDAGRATRRFFITVWEGFGRFHQALQSLPTRVTEAMRNLYLGVKTWLQDRLGEVFARVEKRIETVEGAFRWLWDKVVGNSWVPDMVEAIGRHMEQLDDLMVGRAQKVTKGTSAAFREMAFDVRGILDRLYPEVARLMRFREDLSTLRAAPGFTDEEREENRKRLRREFAGLPVNKFTSIPIVVEDEKIRPRLDNYKDLLKDAADKTKVHTVRIAKSFKDMAEDTLGALRRMTDAIKGGGFLDILEAVIGFGLQLGSLGVFGKKIADNINRTPGYAVGTRNHPGGLAWVGERGPELVSMPRGSQVFTNRESMGMMGGRLQVEVVANNNGFGAIVRNHAGQVVAEAAPTLMGGGAQMAGQQARFQRSRRLA